MFDCILLILFIMPDTDIMKKYIIFMVIVIHNINPGINNCKSNGSNDVDKNSRNAFHVCSCVCLLFCVGDKNVNTFSVCQF